MRQLRGHSIPVETAGFYIGTEAETSNRGRIDGNHIEPKIVPLVGDGVRPNRPLGLMTPTKARLW